MNYIQSPKLNDKPINIQITATGQCVLFEHPKAHRQYIWNKLRGSGVNRSETNRIADAIRSGRIVFIGNRGYIDGTLVETPSQHVTFDIAKPNPEWMGKIKLTDAEYTHWIENDSDYERHEG